MKTKTILSLAVALPLILALAIPDMVWGWTSWGPVWSQSEIPVLLEARGSGTPDCSGTTEFPPLSRAGRTWNEVTCSNFAFSVGPGHPNSRSAPVFDGVNNITWDFGYGGLAVTYGWWSGNDRQECDTIFNEQYSWKCEGNPGPGQYDTETVGLHEIGHTLGLGHSSNSQAVMYAYYQGVRGDPHQDDINGVCGRYPSVSGAPAIEVNLENPGF